MSKAGSKPKKENSYVVDFADAEKHHHHSQQQKQRRHRQRQSSRERANEFNASSLTDEEEDESTSSSKTLESLHESAPAGTESDDSNWKRQTSRANAPARPLSQVISGEELRASSSVRLRSLSQLPQLKNHRSSADVYMLEDAARTHARYSLSPQRQQQQQQQQTNSMNHFGPGSYTPDSLTGCCPSPMYSSLSHLANYQIIPPPATNYGHQAAIAAAAAAAVRSNYVNMCRGGCEHCPPGGSNSGAPLYPVACHPIFDPRLAAYGSSSYWDCGPGSLPNTSYMTMSSGPGGMHANYMQSAPSPYGTLRKNVNNNNLEGSNGNASNAAASDVSTGAQEIRQQQHQNNHHHQQQARASFDKSSSELPDYFSSTSDLQKQQQLQEREREEHLFQQRLAQSSYDQVVDILRNQLFNTEDLFKKALVSKKTLENSNQNLLNAVDKLKLELTHSETRRKLTDEHRFKLEIENEQLKTKLLEKETEISSLRLTLAKVVRTMGYVMSDNELELLRGNTIASDFIKNKLHLNYAEISPKMSTSVPSASAFYSEPSSRRESYSSRAVSPRFHSTQPSPASTPPVKVTKPTRGSGQGYRQGTVLPVQGDGGNEDAMIRSSSVENMKTSCDIDNQSLHQQQKQPISPSEIEFQQRIITNPYSTLPHNNKALRLIQRELEETERQIGEARNASQKQPSDVLTSPSAPPRGSKLTNSTPSSPLSIFKSSAHPVGGALYQPNTNGVTFAKDDEMIPLPSSLQSSQTELTRNGVAPAQLSFNDTKPKGFRRLFSIRKRSTSSTSSIFEAFSRGGTRATSGPRLTQGVEKRFENINLPFSRWDTTLVSDWFTMIGLGMYVGECKRWCRDGEHLMRATSAEVEKELGIRNPLHRKKLRLAVAAMNDDEDELLKNAGRLDYLWIARWLDDIGLPQYKDAFLDARVDGRVLHYLTVEDLFNLKVTSQLHFASIRSGIRILRENKYNSLCLKRRANPEEGNHTDWDPQEVSLWSSHRVMEWLRSIDLSEYAPNLRGSGVHGALILFENAFNANLFATLLSIPMSKTLLRRHISTKFEALIGDDLHRIKSDYECQPNYQAMVPGSKVKAYKKGNFTLRKKRSDYELSDYVCSMMPTLTTQMLLKNLINESKRLVPPSPGAPDSSPRLNEVGSPEKVVVVGGGDLATKSDTEVDQAGKNKRETVIS